MTLVRRMRWLCTGVLAAGVFAILAADSLTAASKAAEAKKAIAELAELHEKGLAK